MRRRDNIGIGSRDQYAQTVSQALQTHDLLNMQATIPDREHQCTATGTVQKSSSEKAKHERVPENSKQRVCEALRPTIV